MSTSRSGSRNLDPLSDKTRCSAVKPSSLRWSSFAIAIFLVTSAHYAEAGTADGTASQSAETIVVKKSKAPFVRLDFQVKASCVSCVRRVAKALKSLRGVTNADVSIYYPHWAVVVINTAETDESKVLAAITKEKAEIRQFEQQDLQTKPILVVPKTDAPRRL
ncbi:MAG: heavy-metal-associated domain-containing protein [Candidatus Obscuribacterales bacterium]|nr:heavy-metal-associated domain-containing protein [Candidatus Obscuribacterales bacterium]